MSEKIINDIVNLHLSGAKHLVRKVLKVLKLPEEQLQKVELFIVVQLRASSEQLNAFLVLLVTG